MIEIPDEAVWSIIAELRAGGSMSGPGVLQLMGEIINNRRKIKELEARSGQGEVQPQWQPMSSAPFNHDLIILAALNKGNVEVGCGRRFTTDCEDLGGEYETGALWKEYPPIAWLPMPAPPLVTPTEPQPDVNKIVGCLRQEPGASISGTSEGVEPHV